MPTAAPLTDPKTLHSWLNDGTGVCLLDVRSPSEFSSAHIPSSHNVPLDELGEHTVALAGISAPVVIVCRSGARAAKAHRHLKDAGLDQASVLDGGMLIWDDGTRPVRRGRTRWDLERQVRLVAGTLVATSIALSIKAPRARYLAGAVGIGLTTAALTNTCTMGMLLAKLPYNNRSDASTSTTVELLTRSRH